MRKSSGASSSGFTPGELGVHHFLGKAHTPGQLRGRGSFEEHRGGNSTPRAR